MRTNLNEEIKKNLKLMGLINEAASPSKGIFRLLFGSLLGPALDNAIAKIEAKAGQKLAGKGIKAFEDAISAGWITRKQATKLIVEALIASGKSIDEIAADITSKTPNFLKSVQNASKSGVDKAEVKAAVPELAELSDDLVDAILKKGGYEGIGSTIADTNKLIVDYVAQFPELFSRKGLFKGGEYKNAAMINEIQQKIFKRFAGKNKTAIADEVKKIIQEASDAIKNSTLPDAEKKKWFQWLSENTPQTVKDVLTAPVEKDLVKGTTRIGATFGRYYKSIILIGLIPSVVGITWSIAKNTKRLVDKADDYLEKQTAIASIESFTEFIKKSYPEYPIDSFTLERLSDTEFSATYTDGQGKAFPNKFVFKDGTYQFIN